MKHLVVTLLSKDSLKIHLQRCAVNRVCDGGGYREPLPECGELRSCWETECYYRGLCGVSKETVGSEQRFWGYLDIVMGI